MLKTNRGKIYFSIVFSNPNTNAFAKHLSPKDKLQHEKSFDEHDYVIYCFIAQPFVSCKYSGENNFFETGMCLIKFGRNA